GCGPQCDIHHPAASHASTEYGMRFRRGLSQRFGPIDVVRAGGRHENGRSLHEAIPATTRTSSGTTAIIDPSTFLIVTPPSGRECLPCTSVDRAGQISRGIGCTVSGIGD